MSYCCVEQHKLSGGSLNGVYFRTSSVSSSDFCFRILSGKLYVIDIRKVPKKCATCGSNITIVLYGKPYNVYATYDGITNIPYLAYDLDLDEFTSMSYYDVLNFGTFLLSPNIYYCTDYFMMYHPFKRIDKINVINDYGLMYMVGDEVAVCCKTKKGKIILVNSNGEIINTETIHSKTNEYGVLTINTQYGKLNNYITIGKYTRPEFTFESISNGLKSKAAIRLTDD